MIALLLAAVALVLAAPMLLLAVRVRRLTRRGLTVSAALLTPGSLLAVFWVAAVYAAGAYGVGVLSGFYFLDPDQMCASAAGFYSGVPGPADELWTGIVRGDLPVRRTCVWADGTRYELVPWWVNPVFFTCLTIAGGAALAGPAARRMDRREAGA